MKDWFMSREPRERLTLAAGAAIAIVIVAWYLVWMPLTTGVDNLDATVDARSRLLVDAQSAAALALVSDPRAPSDQSLYVVVDRTARAHGVAQALTRTRQDGATGIGITFQAAPFDAVLSWLVALERDHGVGVESASFSSSREPGLVSGQVLLRQY